MRETSLAAAEWWGKRLSENHASKRKAFERDLAQRVDAALDKSWLVFISCDYDPQGILLESVRATIDPACRGFMFSADGILPQKHDLEVSVGLLKPKEGYGNWTANITVKEPKNNGTTDHNEAREGLAKEPSATDGQNTEQR